MTVRIFHLHPGDICIPLPIYHRNYGLASLTLPMSAMLASTRPAFPLHHTCAWTGSQEQHVDPGQTTGQSAGQVGGQGLSRMHSQGMGISMGSQQISGQVLGQGPGQIPGQVLGQVPGQVPGAVLGHGPGQATASSSHMMASSGPGLGLGSGLTPGHAVSSLGSLPSLSQLASAGLLSPSAHGLGNLFNEEASIAFADSGNSYQGVHD